METKNEKRITFDELPRTVKALAMNIAEMADSLRVLRDEVEDLRGALMSKPVNARRIPVNIDRACEIIGKSKNTMYRYTSRGLIPHYKRGNSIYFFEDELLEWVRRSRIDQIDDLPENSDRTIIRLDSKSGR